MKLKTEFQDEDFKLGEVADVNIATMPDGRIKAQAVAKSGGVHTFFYDDLKTFTNDWEDYEEPKGTALYWTILALQNFIENEPDDKWVDLEDCKQMLEKLQAWKRLKDKGFDFVGCFKDNTINYEFVERPLDYDEAEEAEQDLAFLFGGEE